MKNNIILPLPQGGFHGAINEYGRVCVGNTSIIKYTTKHTNPMNRITRGYDTCISDMLLQYCLNKRGLKNGEILISFISMRYQLRFYEDIRSIITNKRIKYF